MQKHSFVLFILSRFNYNISAVFLLFYFADDLVSEKMGKLKINCFHIMPKLGTVVSHSGPLSLK